MGLVLIGVGAAGFFAVRSAAPLAALALTAAMLHVVNHAGFKTLLFLGAGSVLRATGTRDLDALGGLRSPMPATTALFGLGALMASALPPGSAFVSEWLLLQSLVHALPEGGTAAAVTMPLAVAVVALTAGLAIAAFVKAFGVGFLAKPRGAAAERARESSAGDDRGHGPGRRRLRRGSRWRPASWPTGCPAPSASPRRWPARPTTPVTGPVTLRPAGMPSTMSPLLITVALVVATVVLLGVLRAAAARRARRRARLWDCGAGPATARMEYTATSFAEPLVRVFDNVLAPETDLDVTPVKESEYLVDSVRYRTEVADRVEHRLYRPVLAFAGMGRPGRPPAGQRQRPPLRRLRLLRASPAC